MDIDSIIKIIVLLFLIILSAFFSSAETALTAVNNIRIHSLAEEGSKAAAHGSPFSNRRRPRYGSRAQGCGKMHRQQHEQGAKA